ncbi:FAD-dependent monooxygenase phqK [Linum perenne]
MAGEDKDNINTPPPKAIIVGGSIAGICCAHSLLLAGWQVTVVEKTPAPPTASSTGAGLGLDPQSRDIISTWLPLPNLLHNSTSPLSIDQNQATDAETKARSVLTRDEQFNFRAAHWADLHHLLYSSFPPDSVSFLWGHFYLSFSVSEDKSSVSVQSKVLQTGEIVEVTGDLLVAADGCLSAVRRTFLPDLELRFVRGYDFENLLIRYSGYCAWRGVFDFSGNEDSDTISDLRKAYPDLGKCLYFDLNTDGTHSVFYELLNSRLNWIWYVHHPKPELRGSTSVTMKVSREMIEDMYQKAEKVWAPELVRLMKETKEPFLNLIYDCDPLEKLLFGDNVVLVGDAAHPTSPHCLRSTNMSILDAAVLGKCVEKWGVKGLASGLDEYQRIRVPVASAQVLHSRRVGRIKQRLSLADGETLFDPKGASSEECEELLQQKNMPFFAGAPLSLH